MKTIKWIFLLLLGGVVVVFSVHNREIVTLSAPFISHELKAPAFILFFIIFITGIAVGGFSAFIYKIKEIGVLSGYKKKIKTLETEIEILKEKDKVINSSATRENNE